MKYAYSDMGFVCELSENQSLLLINENPKCMIQWITEVRNLINGRESKIVITDGEKELDARKYVELIVDPWNIDLNSKKFKNRLYQLCEELASEDYDELLEIKTKLFQFIETIAGKLPYELVYDTEIDENLIFKLVDLRINAEDVSFFEGLLGYINLLSSLCLTKVLFLLNMKCFLTNMELEELYKTAQYAKIQLVFLESRDSCCFGNEKKIVIDKDCCIIEM